MSDHKERLTALRRELEVRGLDGFMLSTGDEHITEWPAPFAHRLAWLTGFTGTAGAAIVLSDHAAMFIDGRYAAAVRDQVDGREFVFINVAQTSIGDWLAATASSGAHIGYDPRLHSCAAVRAVQRSLAHASVVLIAVPDNPVDAIWPDRPPRPASPLFAQPIQLAGKASEEKIDEVAAWLRSADIDATVFIALDSIAWLFNIRSSDIAVAPLGYAFAICRRDGTCDLFVDEAKLGREVRYHLGNRVSLAPYDDFYAALGGMGGQRVSIDPELSPIAIEQLLTAAGASVREIRDPTQLPKQIKNPVEIEGMRQAHIRDGAAVTRFLHWLSIEGPRGKQTELSAAERLTAFRRELDGFHSVSFEPISAADANGARPHYWPTAASNRAIQADSVYLIDSGGQYFDGTTDVTRTVAIGRPRSEVRDRYTRVLKGHIAIARAIFPEGTLGSRLDPLARLALWEAGLDYSHGTGHGVGHFLNVHEGPNHLPASPRPGETGIEAGMILSNEPGYYKPNDYGIRIENLIVAVPRQVMGAEIPMLGFETITWVPLDRELIDTALLTRAELGWIDDYHAEVLTRIAPLVPPDTRAWLEQRTAPLTQNA